MDINYINLNELKDVIKNNNLILIVIKEEDQVFKMMKAQLNKIKSYYSQFKYFIIKDEYASNYFEKEFKVFPQIIITKRNNIISTIRGFRKTNILTNIIEVNF